ncbi:hypothetical protein ATO13_01700 [Stappia sp. 22II-S9-Z10]|nr:hypothetical protein ATO13_01700 [Stappia sp. 22II-S9-Z10]
MTATTPPPVPPTSPSASAAAPAPSDAATARPARPPAISGSGILLGSLFFAASLTPSLVPRSAEMQGLLGGALFAIGYAIAVSVLIAWRWLQLYEPPRRYSRRWAFAAAVIGIAVVALTLTRVADWQDAVRAVMAMPPVEETHTPLVLAIAGATATALFALVWLMRRLFRLIKWPLERVITPRLAFVLGLAGASGAALLVVDGLVIRTTFEMLDRSYAALDTLIEPDTAKPADPSATGSAASLVPWGTLGRDGRRFIDRRTTEAELAAFWNGPVSAPQRVYVGLGSADEPKERAELALAEMLRTGAFDREVLVLALPTGTGFMDPGAIATLEYLHRGSVSTVAVQYSYMQSPFSLIFEPDAGTETGRALLSTVYDHWTQMPRESRPRLYLYGLSLGAYSSERSVRLYEVVGDPFNGALWAGPPFVSPIHHDVTMNRNPGSPMWLPAFENGAVVRTMNQDTITSDGEPWGPLRILYFQHASDAIVFFDYTLFWRRPDWLVAPRGPDVTDTMRWWPIVTALQVAADMMLATHVPRGYGHEYAASRYIDVWVTLTDPDVTPADIARLKARFDD